MRHIKIALSAHSPPKEFTERRFEELFQIKYLPHLEWSDWEAERWLSAQCQKAERKGKIGDLARWLGSFHGKAIEQARVPDVSIRWMNEKKGYGLFTDRPFSKWEFIGEYTGILRRRRLFVHDTNDYCFMYPRCWISLKNFTIDAEKQGNFTRFINHSDYPNVESISVYYGGIFHIIFRALKDLPAHTELVYDYGEIYWRGREKIQETSAILGTI